MAEDGRSAENVLNHPSAGKRPIQMMTAIRAFAGMISRSRLGRILTSFDGKRNYQEIFGWDAFITPEMMLYMYNRGGIAKRVVDSYPDAVWARPPSLWTQHDDAWTTEWNKFALDANLWHHLHRLDRLAYLGHFAVLLVGTDKPALDTPITSASKITYLQPYGETSIQVSEWDRDTTSPTFGRPTIYRVYPQNAGLTAMNSSGLMQAVPVRTSFRVHASRIIHVARNSLEDEIYGQPIMAPVWDYLTDLRKVVGSSSESYWITANRGLQADVDKEMSLTAEDQAALQEEVEDFYNGFRRFIRTKGVTMNALANEIADPLGAFNVLITLISGTTAIPKRVLIGSEAGQLASTQDKGNWAERVEECRALHVEPTILKPLVKWVIKMGLVPAPSPDSIMHVLWPDAYRMSPLERGQTQAQTARSIANVTKMLESKAPEARTLLNRDEIRALLGFSSDNRILKDEPAP